MADDREPIAGRGESSNDKKQRKGKKPKEPRRYRDENDYDDDDASKGKCSCRKEFFCSMEGILKLIEFVCFCQIVLAVS